MSDRIGEDERPGPESDGAAVLDLRDLNCPLPVLKTARRLVSMAPGTRLVVEASDPMTAIDLPHFCYEHGHRLVSMSAEGAIRRYVIEKGAG